MSEQGPKQRLTTTISGLRDAIASELADLQSGALPPAPWQTTTILKVRRCPPQLG